MTKNEAIAREAKMGMIYYAIPDLHGRYDLLMQAVETIAEHAGDNEHKLVFLGDYIDRGPDSRRIIEHLMAHPEYICLRGNHEQWMIDIWHGHLDEASDWLHCGGWQTLYSYGHPKAGQINMTVVPEAHIRWLESLPLYHETERHVFVHAMVDESMDLADHSDMILTWGYYPKGADIGYRGKLVVHGHHSHEHGPLILPNRVNLDCRAWETGRLAVGIFGETVGILTIQGDAQ